jgi:peptidoglycan/LPS O-acetylase OafA/YrhL
LSWPFLLTKFSAKRIIWVICFGFIFLCIAAVYIFKLLYIPYVYNGKTFSLFQDGFRPMHFFIPAAAPIIIGSMGALLLFKKNNLLTKYFTGNYKILFLSIVIYASSLFLPVFLLPIFLILNSFGVTAFLLWLYCNQQSRLAAVLEAKPLVYIGKISYGLYIYQGVFLRTSPGGHLLIQQFPVNLLLTCIVAIASYHLLEKRMLRLKSRFQ